MQLPPLFHSRMQQQLGTEAPAFFDSYQHPVPVSVRLNPLKPFSRANTWQNIPWHPLGYYLPQRPDFTSDPLFHAGAYYVQEASSMFLHQVMQQVTDLRKPLKVLDLCAAPGGKSTLLLGLLNRQSLLVANEVIRSRVQVLKQNISKWGSPNVLITHNDPGDFGFLENYFDVVVVDAPCSGEGMFRKDEKAQQEWSPEHVGLCAARQNRILDEASLLVKPGGILIYSTCTFADDENENQLVRLCENGNWQSKPVSAHDSWGITATSPNGIHGYRFYPHKVKGEGLFIACLQKTTGGEHDESPGKKLSLAPETQRAAIAKFLNQPDDFSYVQGKEQVYVMPAFMVDVYAQWSSQLTVVQCGFPAGKFAGSDFIPSHELALSSFLKEQIPFVNLSLPEALLFLKKGTLRPANDWPLGWVAARYQSQTLGWMKVMPNRVNNYYPTDWRILKDIEI